MATLGFKPVTLILLLLLAWQAPMFNAISYLVLAGLCASLLGDALTLLPRQRVMYAVGAFFPVTSAVYHLVRQPADAVVLLAAATGAAGIRRPANGGDLESAGRDENAGADLYRNDAGNGLAGR